MNRRSFLTSLGALGAAACAGRRLAATATSRPIGLQLYTLRRAMQQDMPGTLTTVAGIGYKEVEFAGTFGRSPAEVRAMLGDRGLKAPSTHLDYALLANGWQKALDDAKAIGHEWVTIPFLQTAQRGPTADGWKRTAAALTEGARQAHAAGLKFAYHNHDFEMKPVEGVLPLEILLRETDPALVQFEMDVYWVVKGGGDPLALLAAHPGRFAMLHLKDAGPPPDRAMLSVGAGTIDWRAVLGAARDARHVFVEHDNPSDPLASVRASYEYLSALR